MSTFSQYHISQLVDLRQRVDKALKPCATMQVAAQRFVDILYEEFEESTVLARVYGTVAFRELPGRDKEFVRKLAGVRECVSELNDETTVISLLGTRGTEASWNDRYRSAGRLGIPVLSCSFIKTIPMVSVLVSETVTGIGWMEKQKSKILVTSLGKMARMIYVHDAATDLTGGGVKTVAVQNFVWDHDVKTVIGIGGSYVNRSFVSIMIFTNETVTAEMAKKFMPLVNTFKTVTTAQVMNRKIFS